jgi:hypothetical protein
MTKSGDIERKQTKYNHKKTAAFRMVAEHAVVFT